MPKTYYVKQTGLPLHHFHFLMTVLELVLEHFSNWIAFAFRSGVSRFAR